jgi:D-lactate dehydrogenase
MDQIVFFEIEEWEKEHLQTIQPQLGSLFTTHKTHEETDESFFQSAIISTFIYSDLSREVLAKFPNLKLIATRSTGFDHIDIDYCREKGIAVANVPTYGAHAVAEHTFALILALSRKLIPTIERSRKGDFDLGGLRGFDLSGKTIGVIGAGKIGSKVVDLALAFEMNVLVFTKSQANYAVSPANVKHVSFDELIGNSDIVTLHVPETPETHHIINQENIMKFKKGSILINTARGPLVETQAILKGLETGILKAAGLDVLDEECFLKEERELLTDDYLKKCDIKTQLLDHILLNRPEVIYTSHNAFNSEEAVRQILDVTVENIKMFQTGKTQNSVI